MTRWDPFVELAEATERLSRVFNRPRNGGFSRQLPNGDESLVVAEWAPACDVRETTNEYLIKADLPDLKKEDVKVSVNEGVLAIEGERQSEKEEKGTKLHRVERSYGKFLRAFTLPPEVEATKVNAEFKNGVLNVHLPKTLKAAPKAIEVKVPRGFRPSIGSGTTLVSGGQHMALELPRHQGGLNRRLRRLRAPRIVGQSYGFATPAPDFDGPSCRASSTARTLPRRLMIARWIPGRRSRWPLPALI
jgi:HSP20 family protein